MDFTCHWENGNPPTSAQLINNRGEEVEISKGEVRHKIHSVDWHDAGIWTCKTQGSIENRTVTLTVKGEYESQAFA